MGIVSRKPLTWGVALVAMAMMMLFIVNPTAGHHNDEYEENGPKSSDKIGDGGGTSHKSYVYYQVWYDPYYANVREVYYGARRPDPDNSSWTNQKWRKEFTRYYEWNVQQWVKRRDTGAGVWRYTPASGTNLVWLSNDTGQGLNGGGRVDQRVDSYLFQVWPPTGAVDITGELHQHFLE